MASELTLAKVDANTGVAAGRRCCPDLVFSVGIIEASGMCMCGGAELADKDEAWMTFEQ